jgi:predicted aldo/keto reductase-like oxidoreductase
MKMSRLGKTALIVSAIGLGGHEYRWLHAGNIVNKRHVFFNPERERVVARALDGGINYFDTTYQEEVQSLGHILGRIGRKKDVVINGMMIDLLKQINGLPAAQRKTLILSELDVRLELMGREYFDIFMLCNLELDYDPERALEALDIFRKEKQKGKLRFIGISGHDYDRFLDFLALDPEIDVVMFPYNYFRAHQNGSSLSQLMVEVKRRDLGFVAIKPLCWSVYGVPFTAINAEWFDIQELIRHAFAWQVGHGEAHSSVVGVETTPEMETILSGVSAQGIAGFDERYLAPYLDHYERLDLLVRNGLKHPVEIQSRIVTYLRNRLQIDGGDSLDSYLDREDLMNLMTKEAG